MEGSYTVAQQHLITSWSGHSKSPGFDSEISLYIPRGSGSQSTSQPGPSTPWPVFRSAESDLFCYAFEESRRITGL